ncbi:MAG: MFS transporter, partial [Chloroflexi bacterium]|nr:MFS transporter [Chloroflexota bacterium]
MMYGPMMERGPRGGTAVAAPPGEVRRPSLGVRTFQSLKVRDFRYYLASSLFQMASMNMQMVASGWFMYKLTGSTALLGLTALVSAIPQLILSFPGGILADRVSKKAILIVGLVASGLVALWIALST